MRILLVFALLCAGCREAEQEAAVEPAQPVEQAPPIAPAKPAAPIQKAEPVDPAEQVRQAVAEHVSDTEAKERDALLELVKDLNSDDSRIRYRALSKILHSDDARLIPAMQAALSDPNAGTRHDAILALHRAKAQDMGDIVGAMLSDPDGRVRHAAAEYGRHLGYKSNLAEVQSFLEKEDNTSHSTALHLSKSLPNEQAVPIIAGFLDHRSHHYRKRAVLALADYDAKLIKPYIVDILVLSGDSDSWVRSAVRKDLRTFGPIATQQQLEELAEHESPEVRAMAKSLLEK